MSDTQSPPEEKQDPIVPETHPAPPTLQVDWKSKYDGLQGAFSQMKEKHDQVVLSLNDLRQQYEGETATIATERTEFETQITSAQHRIQELEGTNQTLTRRGEVRTVIAQRGNPELTTMYDQGLLLGVDGLEDEALGAHLDKLTEHLGSVQQQAYDDKFAGSSPAPKGGGKEPATMSSDEMYERLMSLPSGSEDYDRLYTTYLNSLDKEG